MNNLLGKILRITAIIFLGLSSLMNVLGGVGTTCAAFFLPKTTLHDGVDRFPLALPGFCHIYAPDRNSGCLGHHHPGTWESTCLP